MSDLITQLCQLTAEILKANPQGDLAELVELVKKSIEANSQLGEAIQSDLLTQVNRDGSKGYQTWVAGGVANIGNTYLNDVKPEILQEILQRVLADVLKSQPQVKQTALENVNAGGDINATITQKIHLEPNKLAENLGLVAQDGSAVSIGTFIVNNRQNEDRSKKVLYDQRFYNNLGDREIDRDGNFVGRDKDLEKLHDLLQAQSECSPLPMVLISGMAGMGKSELARQYGKLHLDYYAGGVGIFEAALFGESLRDFMQSRFCEDRDLRHFTKLETQVEEGWQQWQKFCGKEKIALILIDDVTEYQTQVLPYLPKSLGDVHPFRFVLTSRSLLQGKLEVLEIRELKTEAALQLLTKWAEPNQQTLLDNPEIATSLCNRLGCLPLALTLVGSWLKNSQATLPIAIAELEQNGLESEVLEPYKEAPENIDPDKNIKQGLKAVLMVIWQQLSPDAQQLGRVLSLFEPINLPWELVVSVVQAYPNQSEAPPVRKNWWQTIAKPAPQVQAAFVPIRNLKKAEIELWTKSLLQSVEEGKTYRLHRLVHEFFGAQWADSDREGWVNAWVRGLSDRAQEIPASADWEQVTTWQTLRPHLESAKKIAENLRHTTKSSAAIAVYKSQANNLIVGCFRLDQAPIFEATYRQAINKHDRAKAALAEGQNALAQNYFDEAVKVYQRAIEQARGALPENSSILAGYLNRIAELFFELGNYSAGIPPADEAVKIVRVRAKSHKLASYLNNLAGLYESQGRYEDAEPLYKQALSLSQELLGDSHPNVATGINNLGGLYSSQGRYEEAEPLLKQALSLHQELLGERHPDVATIINNLAGLYSSLGRYEEAEPLLKQALSLHQELLGERHPDVATIINNLAELHRLQGRYEEAESLLKQALSLHQELLGERHPDVASSINTLAELHRLQGRYEEAEPLLKQALSLRQELLGERHPYIAQSMNNLALLYYSRGRYEEAEPLFKQALALNQELLGDHHPNVASSMDNLALLYESQGRYEEAEPLFKQALALRQELLGDRHPDVAKSINNLALLYKSQGRYEEAESLFKQALALRQELLGDHHPDVATSINNLAGLYSSQGKYEEAEPLFKQALALRQELLDDRHPDVAGSLFCLAVLYHQMQKHSEAVNSIQSAIQIYEQTLGIEHPHTKAAMSWLLSIRVALNSNLNFSNLKLW